MKKSFFNIAWDPGDDLQIRDLLVKYGFEGIELAASKIWVDPTQVKQSVALDYKNFWLEKKIRIIALCSLLYPHNELNIFKSSQIRNHTLLYLKQIVLLASTLGAKILVFGSPRNRTFEGITEEEAFKIAAEFFRDLANICASSGVIVCIEPVPKKYQTNFVNNTSQAIKLIQMVNHSNFKLHLDSGALTMNSEDYNNSISDGFKYLEHFHISEDNLIEIGSGKVDHIKLAAVLNSKKYNQWASVEMPAIDSNTDIAKIKRVMEFVRKTYD